MTATETGGKVLENVFENIRKAAETTLKMQQEVFQQWSTLLANNHATINGDRQSS